jgi:hypothetical protein
MDKLFDELAKSLNVSTDLVQQFVGNYPQLRSQWQWYNLFDLWDNYLNVVLLVLLGIMIYLGVKYHSDLEYSSEEEVNVVRKRWLKKLVPIVLVMFIIDFALVSIKTILAPDITMLFEVLKQLKN